MTSTLEEIIKKLKDAEIASQGGSIVTVPIPYLFSLANALERETVGTESYAAFLKDVFPFLIKLDAARKSTLLRVIRYCLQGPQHAKLLVQEEIHWIVVATLEKDNSAEFNVERIQALKLVDKVRKIAPECFPVAFARSLVAIANSKEDNLRRLCLDSLRELTLVNPSIVGTTGGFTTLLEAISDPISTDSAEKILHTILFLLNDPATRKVLMPCVDLKILIAAFSDLDTEEKELTAKWMTAKTAFLNIMKTWVGVFTLTSDDLALPFLMRMLRDAKVPSRTHNIILECLSELLTPIITAKTKSHGYSRGMENELRHAQSKPAQPSDVPDFNRTRAISDSDLAVDQVASNREKGKDKTLTSSGSSNSLTSLAKDSSNASRPAQRPSFSLTEGFRSVVGVKHSNSGSSLGSVESLPNTSPTAPKEPAQGTSKPFSLASLFGRSNNSAGSPGGGPLRRGSTNNAIQNKSSMPTVYPPTRPESVRVDKKSKNTQQPIVFVQKPNQDTSKPQPSPNSPSDDPDFEFDTVYNLMDNYAALICCSLLHVDLIQTLFVLGTEGQRPVAIRSRKLLVVFLKILSNVLPENVCAKLLTSPALIELASAVGQKAISPTKTYKASLILLEIANTFSIMPMPQNYSIGTNFAHDLPLNSSFLPSQSSVSNQQMTSTARNRAGSVRGSVYIINNNTNNKSNFPSLNIQNLFLLMEEVKVCSRVTSTGDMGNSKSSDLLMSINNALVPNVDKAEFTRQIEQSRVNQGKEPFKWDWILISEMFEHSFTSPDRLSEALKTKFLKRISGFFRCSSDEKGFFANLDWEPNNLQYLECACNLYSVLLKDEVGIQFLTSDRRGLIFTEIAREIELVTNYASNKFYQQYIRESTTSRDTVNLSSNGPKMVFRMHSCNYSMAREFFTLLGRILRDSKSRKLLDQANVFNHLTVLGQYPSLDYISRLVITSLSFTDGGNISRHLYQFWTADETAGSCSKLLKEYLYNLLRVLIRCHQNHNHDVYLWCVETTVSQLSMDDDYTNNILSNDSLFILYKAMTESIHSKTCIKVILDKRPRFILNHYNQILQVAFPTVAVNPESNAGTPSDSNSPPRPTSTLSSVDPVILEKEIMLHNIIIRLMGVTEGLQFVMEKNYFEMILNIWMNRKSREYVEIVEDKINESLFHISSVKFPTTTNTSQNVDMLTIMQPIPIRVPDIALATFSEYNLNQPKMGSPNVQGGISSTFKQFNPNGHLDFDFHGLFRVPWNIEAKVISHGLNVNDPSLNSGEYLRVDAFLDISEVNSPLSYEVTYDKNRYLKVRGIILDSKGFPGGKAISPNSSISCTLLAGISPIFKNGTIQTILENLTARKRASTNSRDVSSNTNQSSSRASFVGQSASTEVFQDNDLPITLGQESFYEWTTCRPGHRQGPNLFELQDGRFSVAIPGEPVTYIFSRKAPVPHRTHGSRSGSLATGDPWGGESHRSSMNRMDSSRSGGMLFLVEIHYFLSIETGQSIFVPMPRHLFSELTRTISGCDELLKRNVIFELVSKVRTLYDSLQKTSTQAPYGLSSSASSVASILPQHQTPQFQLILQQHATSTLELRSVLWSLGHIGSNDPGMLAILRIDPNFIEWCIECIVGCLYYNMRGTFFYLLGLLSRSSTGAKKLSKLLWDHSDLTSNSAVAVPRMTSQLFGKMGVASPNSSSIQDPSNASGMKKATLALSRLNAPQAPVMPFMNNLAVPASIKQLQPYNTTGSSYSTEQEVLNIIVKMPGVILYRECKSRLDYIRREHSDIFSKHSLYVEVMKILEVYNYKLSARRDILSLFTDAAKLKPTATEAAE